ncbi:MAG: hypothetical protein WA981_16010 [Glaciecola sp.]
MNNWITQAHYLMMLLQVVVTLVLIPLISYKILLNIATHFGLSKFPSAITEVNNWLSRATRHYVIVVLMSLCAAGSMVSYAMFKQIELLNWDDQSGLMMLYLISMIPVIKMVLMHRALFGIFKQHMGSKRSASLQVRTWQTYISLPLLGLIGIANIVFILTVVYFVEHPFDGFAGYTNFFGLLINVVFAAIIAIVYRDRKTFGLHSIEHQDVLKKRAIHINMLILAIALFHISLSMWVQGSSLAEYKLFTQSMYFQIILIITAVSFTLPKSLFQK